MKYEIINKELGIAACGIKDLTMNQVHQFLTQWGDGSSIGTLTLFYDKEENLLVLNKDHGWYDTYLMLAERYIGNESEREKLKEKLPESFKEALQVIDGFVKHHTAQEEIKRAFHNHFEDAYRPTLQEIRNYSHEPIVITFLAFRYGMMCGKREERARRRK